jgi:hypothetical protein
MMFQLQEATVLIDRKMRQEMEIWQENQRVEHQVMEFS